MPNYTTTLARPSAEVKDYASDGLAGWSPSVRSLSPQCELGELRLGADNELWMYIKASGAISGGSACSVNTSTFAATDVDGIKASGSILYADNPTATETFTLNGTSWMWVAAGASGQEINIGGNLAASLAAAKAALNASVETQTVKCTYDVTGGNTLTIEFKTVGATGNSFTLAATGDATPSGATLSGGVATGGLIASSGAFADGEHGWIKKEPIVI